MGEDEGLGHNLDLKHNLMSAHALLNICYKMGHDARKQPVLGVCEQQRRRPACASAQSDQRLYYSLNGKYHI